MSTEESGHASGYIYYYSPTTSDSLNSSFNVSHYVGAASAKVFQISNAVRSQGRKIAIVSSSYATSRIWGRRLVHRSNGVPFIRVFSIGRRSVKRISSSFGFLFFSILRVRSSDRVVLYNFFPEYILCSIYLYIVGNPVFIDIEDAPRKDESGIRSIVNRVSFSIIRKLARKKYIVASNKIATDFNLLEACCIYGSYRSPVGRFFREMDNEKISVLYGGSIIRETGAELFCSAVDLLAMENLKNKVEFNITGHYDGNVFSELKVKAERNPKITINLYRGLSQGQYISLLGRMNVGLQLKLSGFSMSDTTFPSKIVQFLFNGLVVIGTSVSDLSLLFSDKNMILLETEEPEELKAKILWCLENPGDVAVVADAGFARAKEVFSEEVVGRRFIDFIYG